MVRILLCIMACLPWVGPGCQRKSTSPPAGAILASAWLRENLPLANRSPMQRANPRLVVMRKVSQFWTIQNGSPLDITPTIQAENVVNGVWRFERFYAVWGQPGAVLELAKTACERISQGKPEELRKIFAGEDPHDPFLEAAEALPETAFGANEKAGDPMLFLGITAYVLRFPDGPRPAEVAIGVSALSRGTGGDYQFTKAPAEMMARVSEACGAPRGGLGRVGVDETGGQPFPTMATLTPPFHYANTPAGSFVGTGQEALSGYPAIESISIETFNGADLGVVARIGRILRKDGSYALLRNVADAVITK